MDLPPLPPELLPCILRHLPRRFLYSTACRVSRAWRDAVRPLEGSDGRVMFCVDFVEAPAAIESPNGGTVRRFIRTDDDGCAHISWSARPAVSDPSVGTIRVSASFEYFRINTAHDITRDLESLIADATGRCSGLVRERVAMSTRWFKPGVFSSLVDGDGGGRGDISYFRAVLAGVVAKLRPSAVEVNWYLGRWYHIPLPAAPLRMDSVRTLSINCLNSGNRVGTYTADMHRALLECFPNVTTLILKQSLSGLRNVPWWKTVIPEISQSRITTLKVLYSDVSLDLTAALAIFPNLVSLGEVDLSTARSWGRATSTYPSVTSLHVRLSLDALADLNELSAWLESAAPHILRLLPRLRRLGIQPVRIHLPMRAGFTSEPLPPPTATLLDQDKFSQPWHAFVRGLAVQDIVLRSVRDEVHGDVSGSMGRSGGGGGGALGQAHNRMYDALELALRAACVCAGKRFRHDVGMADGSAEGDDE